MRTLIPLALTAVYLACTLQPPTRAAQAPAPEAAAVGCGPLGAAYLRTTLYFGLNYKAGTVSESQWRMFLRGEVTPRIPDGLTVWEANGQWRRPDGHISREKAKVLLLVHGDSAEVRAALGAIVSSYKQAFQQESVLWETAPVCAAF
jgi:hypothetical protein